MNSRKLLAAVMSMALITGAASCGKIDSSSETSADISGETEIVTSTDTDNGGDTSNSADEAGAPSSDSKNDNTEGTTKDKDSSDSSASSSDDKGSGDSSSSDSSSGTPSDPSGNTSSGSSSSSGGSSSPSGGSSSAPSSGGSPTSGGGSSSGNSSSSGSGSTGSSGGQAAEAPTEASEEKVYTAEITLSSSPKVTGQNVTVSGSVVTITAGGDYRFSGKLTDGQIFVNTATEESVTVVLDGVDIHNSSGPAIFVNEAKKCTIKVREGTVNNLSDGGKDKINNGVIFSNDTLRFKGNGTLNINSGNEHGIASDDDIIIENGIYNITSVKSGLSAHDDITISGGTLDVKGGTNGLKSKGTINITGGTATVSGGTKEEKSSIYAAGSFNYTGGYLFAAGNQVSPPTYSENPYIVVDTGESTAAGSSVELFLNGKKMVSFKPHNNFRSIMMLAPEITSGSSFYASISGKSYSTKTVSDGQNVFTLD